MIVNSVIRYFSGSVTFEAKNGFCERLINLCAGNNVSLWNFHKIDEGFRAVCKAADLKKIQEYAQKVNVEVTVVRKKGFFFKANKYRKRWGMFAGIVAFFAFLFISQCFIWDIQVSGNEKVPAGIILAELRDLGITRFKFIPGIDFRQKNQEAMLALPQMSWLAINRNGCRITVEVKERIMPPLIYEDTVCDVVASRTGQVKYIEVYDGEAQVETDYTVKKGDVLVKGVYAAPNGKLVKTHASAKVIAQVQIEKSISLDMEQFSKEYTGETKKRYYLELFSTKLPLFLATKVKGDYDVTGQEHPITLFGKELPLGIYSLHYRFYEKKSASLSKEDARKVLENSFLQYEASELKNTAILSRDVKEAMNGNLFTMTVSYVAEQNIARQVELDPSEIPRYDTVPEGQQENQ